MPPSGGLSPPDTIVPEPLYPQEFNRYAYSRNNPITLTDPTGRFTFVRHAIISYRIAQEQGFGIFQSLAYALQTAWQDNPGRQSTGLYDTVGHMTSGLLPGSDPKEYATPEETFQVALIRAAVALQEGNIPFVLHQAEDSAARGHVVDNIPQRWDADWFSSKTYKHFRTDFTFTDQEERLAEERSILVFEIQREIVQRKLVDFEDIYELLGEVQPFGPGPAGFSPLSPQELTRLLEGDDVASNPLGRLRVGGGSYNIWVNTYLQNGPGSGFYGGNSNSGYANWWEDDPYWEDDDW